jgi:hypothetical protein
LYKASASTPQPSAEGALTGDRCLRRRNCRALPYANNYALSGLGRRDSLGRGRFANRPYVRDVSAARKAGFWLTYQHSLLHRLYFPDLSQITKNFPAINAKYVNCQEKDLDYHIPCTTFARFNFCATQMVFFYQLLFVMK